MPRMTRRRNSRRWKPPRGSALRNVGKDTVPAEMREVRERLRLAVSCVTQWTVKTPVGDEPGDFTGETWTRLDAEIAAAIEAGDVHRAMCAIEAWEHHAREQLKGS